MLGLTFAAFGGLPFLVTIHSLPLVAFHAEWLAAFLGVTFCAATMLGRTAEPGVLPLPAVALAPLGVAVAVAAQWLTGMLPYGEQGQLVLVCLVWAVLLMSAASAWRERFGLASAVRWLCWGLLLAAVASASISFVAHLGFRGFPAADFAEGALYGNLGQRNHFSHLLWLGLGAVAYLGATRALPSAAAVAVALLLLTMSATTGSRATLLYAAWGALLFGLGGGARRRGLALALFAGYLLAAATLPGTSVLGWTPTPVQSPVLRAVSEAAPETAIRPTLLAEAWRLFVANPWLGAGWGSYRAASFENGDRVGPWQGGAEHSHNLFANLLAETGLLATLAVAVLLAAWLVAVARRGKGHEDRFLLFAAGIALLHAQVEYPFWYLYFLGPFVVILALGETRTWRLPLRRLPLLLLVLGGLGAMFGVGRDYLRLEAVVNSPRTANEADAGRKIEDLLALRKGSLLAPQVDIALLGVMAPTHDNLQAKRQFCELSLAYFPSRPGSFTCALVAELSGDAARADRLWRLSVAAGGAGVVADYLALQRRLLTAEERAPLGRFLNLPSGSTGSGR